MSEIVFDPPVTEEIEVNQKIYDEYFDKEYCRALAKNVAKFLEKLYFRAVMVGFEETEERNNPNRPLIYVSNHSGMAFPWDGMIFSSMFLRKHNFELKNAARPLSAPMLSQTNLMSPFMIPNLWRKVGCIDATFLNFETMMFYQESNIFLYPEGVPGIGKGFNRKYQLQRMSSSFVYMSLKYKTDIIPFYTINGEYINPRTYSIDWVNNLAKKIGVPFVPIGLLTPFLLLQPWMFYFSFPAKLTYVRGERIPYESLSDKNVEDLSREELKQIAERCRLQFQQEIDAAVEKYGKNPYSFKEHLSVIFKNWQLFPYTVPQGWPLLFREFENKWKKRKEGEEFKLDLGWFSTLRILITNPILICYFIPIIGWIPLLVQGYRKSKG